MQFCWVVVSCSSGLLGSHYGFVETKDVEQHSKKFWILLKGRVQNFGLDINFGCSATALVPSWISFWICRFLMFLSVSSQSSRNMGSSQWPAMAGRSFSSRRGHSQQLAVSLQEQQQVQRQLQALQKAPAVLLGSAGISRTQPFSIFQLSCGASKFMKLLGFKIANLPCKLR